MTNNYLQELLSQKSAQVVKSELILKNPNERIQAKNIDYPYDLNVLHKMKQELNSALDLDDDDFIDILKLRKYLQLVPASNDDLSRN